MLPNRRSILTCLCFLAACVSVPAWAQADRNQKLVKKLSAQQTAAFESLTTMSPRSLAEIVDATSAERIEQRVRELLAEGNLGVGSRPIDEDGRALLHRTLEQWAQSLAPHGVHIVGKLVGEAAAPVVARDAPGTLRVGEAAYDVSPLWPNGAMPSLTPQQGLEGPLVYVGRGDWQDIEGLDLRGAIAVMHFEGGRNFERLLSHGALAVIVVEDKHVVREKAERLFCNTPIPFPRFYASAAVGEQLIDRAVRKVYNADGSFTIVGEDDPAATLSGGHVYANRRFESLFVYLPPGEPVVHRVKPGELLQRIADGLGMVAESMAQLNGLQERRVTVGQELKLPGKTDTYKVKPEDLLTRLATAYGVTPDALKRANPERYPQVNPGEEPPPVELKPGDELTVPNVAGPMVIRVPIDSVSVAPDVMHGATAAANIATAMAIVEHLATSPNTVRRKGLLLVFQDAEMIGGGTSRAVAGAVLENTGEFVTEAGEAFPVATLVTMTLLGLFVGGLLGYFVVGNRAVGSAAPAAQAAADADDAGNPQTRAGVLWGVGGALVLAFFVVFPHLLTQRVDDSLSLDEEISFRRAGIDVLTRRSTEGLGERGGKWLVEEWLYNFVDTSRADAAELRVSFVNSRNRHEEGTAAYQRLDAEVDRAQRLVSFYRDLRNRTVLDESVSIGQRMSTFIEMVDEANQRDDLQGLDLSIDALAAQLRREAEEYERERHDGEVNRRLIARLLAVLADDGSLDLQMLDPKHDPASLAEAMKDVDPLLSWELSISDGSPSIGLGTQQSYRTLNMGVKDGGSYENRMVNALAFAGFRAGWSVQWPLLRQSDKVDVPLLDFKKPFSYPEFWQTLKISTISMFTTNDRLEKVDTPRDTADNLDYQRLSAQSRTLMLLAKLGVESPVDSLPPDQIKAPKFGWVDGRTVQFNVRQGLGADDPVPGVYVYYPALLKADSESAYNTAAYRGGRPGIVQLSRLDGRYRMPLEDVSFASTKKSKPYIYAYNLDEQTASFDKVVDQGQIGTQKKTPAYTLTQNEGTEKNLVLMKQCYPMLMFPGPDPMNYDPIGGKKGDQRVLILDAVLNGEAEHYATNNPMLQYGENDLDTNILFMESGRRFRMIADMRGEKRLMLVNKPLPGGDPDMTMIVDDEQVELDEQSIERGRGYLVGPLDDARNLSLPLTPKLIARDWLALAKARQDMYAEKGLQDAAVRESLDRAEQKLMAARDAAAQRDWRASNGLAREAWGMLVKVYPRILTLGREAVFSAVVLMALLVPASAFLERLVVGSKSIVARIAGATVIFVLAVAFLKFTHPALLIAVSPFIVMIAFVMILMATIVLVLCYQRFEVLVRRARMWGGEVESEEISLFSSLSTALSLGVSNLKKRPSRTFLTAFTVSVLTFSIITFVSVRGRDTLYMRTLELDRDIEGQLVRPYKPAFEGILFRNFNWRGLDDSFVSALQSEYGADFETAWRGHYIDTEGGNNAEREGVNQMEVKRGDEAHILTGIVTFDPAEPRFSGMHRAVSQQQWFVGEDKESGRAADRFVTILPDVAAAALGISPDDLDTDSGELRPREQLPTVIMRGIEWHVIGILTTSDTVLRPGAVKNWPALAGAILNSPGAALDRVRSLLSESQRKLLAEVATAQSLSDTQANEARDVLNDLIEMGEAYDEKAFAAVALSDEARAILNTDVSVRSEWSDQRLTRLALEAALPGHFNEMPLNADRIRDVSGESLAIVDYLKSAFSSNADGELINEGDSYHQSWERFAIVPNAAAADVEATPRSVVVRFPDAERVTVREGDTLESLAAAHLGEEGAAADLARVNRDVLSGRDVVESGMVLRLPRPRVERFRRDAELRLNQTMFGYINGQVSIITTKTANSVAGVAKIIVPVLLCVLIVLNTMMGAVDERKGEVGMLGAVGLSPSQISFLLLSESMVFSVLGIVFGTLGGLLFANLIAGETGRAIFGELTFNFTSLVSMLLATATGGVVLLATIIPARKAAALAAPSGMAQWELPEPTDDGRLRFELPFTLTRGNAVGMVAFFRRFLLNHTEATSEDFNCRNIRQSAVSDGEPALTLRCDMWLAPYDLDVAQHMTVQVRPTVSEGVFSVWLDIERVSGSEEAWMRTNYGFLNLVRQQFLLWRNLAEEQRHDYIQGGAELLQRQMQPV